MKPQLLVAYLIISLNPTKAADGHQTIIIESETLAFSPANRARTKLGIGEDVTLKLAEGQKATWTLTGPGKINGNITPIIDSNSVKFTAPDDPTENDQPPTITASTADQGTDEIKFTVVKPTGLKFEKIKTHLKQKNPLVVGILADAYITPK